MSALLFVLLCLSRLLHFSRSALCDVAELSTLMDLKASLDPENSVLTSWTVDGEPCRGDFEGVACNEVGKGANISLQGKQLSGSISSAVGRLRSLTGLYLHYNGISGEIPKEIGSLTELSDLYLNFNDLSGGLPEEIGNLAGLRVLQLSYNKLTGSIPTQLGLLKNLAVLNIQSNNLTGAVPASLGDLSELSWLDLSFNQLFGSIPVKLAQLSQLTVLDVQNNSLSGSVPSDFKRLGEQFRYGNNADLCGWEFPFLRACTSADLLNPSRPEPFGAGLKPQDIPESMNLEGHCNRTNCSNSSKSSALPIVIAVTVTAFIVMVSGFAALFWYRRKKQKIGSSLAFAKKRPGAYQANDSHRRTASPLINLEYSNGWDPLADDKSGFDFSQKVSQSFRFNLEEMESATQYFSSVNLLEKKTNFATTYKGILRDGTEVAIKRINKTSCKPDEAEFLKGLKLLTTLRHENLVSIMGFCYSRARGECFLVYNFVENSLSRYLDLRDDEKHKVLNWPTRVSIIRGIAEGIEYLHSNRTNKHPLVIQSLSAEKILIDHHFHPLLSGLGLHKLLADDVVFSTLKASAAMGYLAPEYTTIGRFSEKSDVYAFGVLVFQILTGKRRGNHLCLEVQSGKLEDLIDENLEGRYSRPEAAKLAGIALLCMNESPNQRPMMDTVVQELSSNQ